VSTGSAAVAAAAIKQSVKRAQLQQRARWVVGAVLRSSF